MKKTISLPSGAKFELARLNGAKLVELSGAVGPESTKTTVEGMSDFFRVCFVQVVEPGPYRADTGDTFIDPMRVLIGDLYWAFINVAAMSRSEGATYEISWRCKSCGRFNVDYTFDAIRDLIMKALPKESSDAHKNGRALSMKFDLDGEEKSLTFQLPTPKHDKWLKDWLRQNKRTNASVVDQIMSRTVTVEDVPHNDFKKKWAKLCEYPMPTLKAIDKALDAADCGFQNHILAGCEHCKSRQKVLVFPLDLARILQTKQESESSFDELLEDLPDPTGDDLDTKLFSGEDDSLDTSA